MQLKCGPSSGPVVTRSSPSLKVMTAKAKLGRDAKSKAINKSWYIDENRQTTPIFKPALENQPSWCSIQGLACAPLLYAQGVDGSLPLGERHVFQYPKVQPLLFEIYQKSSNWICLQEATFALCRYSISFKFHSPGSFGLTSLRLKAVPHDIFEAASIKMSTWYVPITNSGCEIPSKCHNEHGMPSNPSDTLASKSAKSLVRWNSRTPASSCIAWNTVPTVRINLNLLCRTHPHLKKKIKCQMESNHQPRPM